MNSVLTADWLAELAVHRVLRGELAPCVHALTAEFRSDGRVRLHVFHHPPETPDWPRHFEETIACEWDQVMPGRALAEVPVPEFRFYPAEAFSTPLGADRLIYVNPWSRAQA